MGIGCGFMLLILGVFCILAGNFMISGSLIQPASDIAYQNAQTWHTIAYVCFGLAFIFLIISAIHHQYRKIHPVPPQASSFKESNFNSGFDSTYEPNKAASNWDIPQQDNYSTDWKHPNSDPRGAYGFGPFGERQYKDGWVDWLNPERNK